MGSGRRKVVAVFTSVDSYEGFYKGTFGITRDEFVASYRNDFVWEYSRGLCAQGHEVVVYMRSYGEAAVERIEPHLHIRFLQLPLWLRPLDSLLFRMRSATRVARLREKLSWFTYKRQLVRALREDEIEVLYHQEVWTPRFDLIVERSPLPVVGAEHGAVYEPWMEQAKRRSIPAAAGITCQSAGALERVIAFGGRGKLLYNGVNTSFFTAPQEHARKPELLAVGRFVEGQKRFADILQALPLLPGFTLVLVGTGPDEDFLRRKAAALDLSTRVEFRGFVSSRTALRELYQQCGVFVSSSSWEATALVLLEAMSCATPVVATRIPSFEDLIENGVNGILVPVGQPELLAAGIRDAYGREGTLGVQARTTVERGYSADRVYEKLSEFLQSV